MAWQVSNRYGKFQPGIDLFPEDDALYDAMQRDVQRDQSLWDVSEWGIMRGFRYPPPIRPIRMKLRSKVKSLPKLFGARLSWAVSQDVIDIIEDLEPSVHRYWPTEFIQKDGSPTEPRWLINICNRLDTIIVEKSDVVLLRTPKGTPSQIVPRFTPLAIVDDGKEHDRLVMSKDKIGQHSLWCGPLFNNMTFISNQLADALRANGVDGLNFEMQSGEV